MIIDKDGTLLFKWLFIGNKKFSEPFFDETISSCLSFQENSSMPFTTAGTLLQMAESVEPVKPSAFIFHISRCGSTLLSQMLCIDESIVVLSEVPLLDDLLRISFSDKNKNIPDAEKLFCAVLTILAQKRNGKEKHLFIKTDSWHLMFFERIRKLFPSIPALILYRAPAEVIRSQQKRTGMHAVQGPILPEIFGFSNEQIKELLPDNYFELVLEAYFRKCLSILKTDYHTKAISYHDGPMKIFQDTIRFCNLTINPEMIAEMEKRTTHHSKYPGEKFSPEIPVVKELTSTFAEELFGKLDEMKKREKLQSS
ncbi:MAG TPA: sulfotransferase family protein, partial [Bacteroidia bacterium]|nr:sulfotransferase family protein [Bacteroidia bacterium]